MKISQVGIDLIKSFEGCVLTAYLCPSNVWTIGYGHTTGVYQGQVITKVQAEQLLKEDIVKYENYVNNTGLSLNQNQFDALVSFTYNCGSGNLKKLIANRSLSEIAEAILLYNKSRGTVLKGLVRRREAERKLFLTPVHLFKENGSMKTYKKGQAVQLSKNFKSTEFDCNGKGCCTETPIEEKLVDVLQKVRDHFGVSVNLNCGYRCPVHNSKTKGASSTSQHMKGNAADIVVKNVHPMRVARFIETIPGFAGRIGCYTWDDSGKGFVHVDVRGTNSRAIYTENNVNYDSVPHFHPTIKRGVTGREVKVVQRRLKKLGYYKKAIDMSCGSGMEQAIIKFNAAHGRANDKSWGPKCWNEAFPIEK